MEDNEVAVVYKVPTMKRRSTRLRDDEEGRPRMSPLYDLLW